MIHEDTKAWLDNTQGLISPEEGRWLAELASRVPKTQAIVEIGTHTGLSACWMAAGSRDGNGAHITCVDPWGEPRPRVEGDPWNDDPWDLGADGVLARFQSNVAGTTQETPREDYGDLVTPLRTTSVDASAIWVQSVGLLFIDAVHTYEAVIEDHKAWEQHVASYGLLALHDYTDSYPGCMEAIDEIAGSGLWEHLVTAGTLWVGRRA